MNAVIHFLRDVGLCFIPLFVATDPVGVLPLILVLTQEASPTERTKTLRYALFTALGLGLGFIVVGKAIFLALGITVADFLVAGGLILLILAIRHLLTGKMVELQSGLSAETIGVAPLGTPILAGPAVLTTLLILIDQYHIAAVVIAYLLNLIVAWVIFAQSNRIANLLRRQGLRAVSQIISLLLAAIAIMMIRRGIESILGG